MDEPTQTLLWLAVLISTALTIRALISRSWLTMWSASLGLMPFVLSTVGLLTIPITAAQLASATALRRHASPRGWAAFTALSLLIWVAIIFSARFTPVIWLGRIPLLPLSLLALLLPLLPPETVINDDPGR